MIKSLSGKKVAVLVETEYIHEEIEFYKKRVVELGGELILLSYLWGKSSMDIVNDVDSPDRSVTSIHRLTITECVTNHDPSEFAIIICAANYVAVRLREIPPMGSLSNPKKVSEAPAVRFFALAMENRKIVKAAMCHALWILTPRPDLLKGREVTCHTVVLADICNTGAIFIPDLVVVDRDLVTARSFSDIEQYWTAILKTTENIDLPITIPSLEITVNQIVDALQKKLEIAAKNFNPTNRPIAKAAQKLLDGSLDIKAEVNRLTNIDLNTSPRSKLPVLIIASKFGTWASELTIVASTLLKAGYKIQIATEDGSPPHFLSASLDTSFSDGAWRCSVVSEAERELALLYLNPNSSEHTLMKTSNIFDLSQLPKPPQVGDYLANPELLDEYRSLLEKSLNIAYEYEAIIITGGSGAIPGLMADRGLHNLILSFHRLRKPIMGECNGGLAMAQTLDPVTDRSILSGRAVTTHSWLDEYQSGWGWVSSFSKDPDSFWKNGVFDFKAYTEAETWHTPGTEGNPLIDSEALFTNASGIGGVFFSPAGTVYSVVLDGNLITCRTTPDGYPGVIVLIALLDGNPPLSGRFYLDKDAMGKESP